MVFEVGDGKTYDGYENKQLSNGQKYKIYSRGLARRATKVNEFNSDVARFTIIVRTYRVSYNKIENRLQVFLVGGKTRNIAVKLVLQQCWKIKQVARFLLPVLQGELF